METLGHHHIFDLQLWKLIERGDLVNRRLGSLIRDLSRFVVGFVLLLVLIPSSLVIIFLTTIISRFLCEYLAFQLKRAKKRIPHTDDRTLMEDLLEVEDLTEKMSFITRDLGNSKSKRIYSAIFFGSSWVRCMKYVREIKDQIEQKVYPDQDKMPTEGQIKRLLEEYKGVSLN